MEKMRANLFLSFITAAIIFIPVYFIFRFLDFIHPLLMTVLSCFGFALTLSIYLSFHTFFIENKMMRIERKRNLSYMDKFNANVWIEGTLWNCNLYFCESALVLVATEGKLNLPEIKWDDISSLEGTSSTSLILRTAQQKTIEIECPEAPNILKRIRIRLPDSES